MNPVTLSLLAVCVFAGALAAADERKAVLDCAQDERLYDTRFVRFGPGQFSVKDLAKVIVREGNWRDMRGGPT